MSFKVLDYPQRSDSWFAVRAGRVTGSRADCVTAKIKSGEAAARRDYRLQLAVERLTGRATDDGGFVSVEMQRGIDLEPKARDTFQNKTGLIVRQTGFLAADDLPIGCSLDGDVKDFAEIVEIKCPKSWTHLQYLKAGALPGQYRAQVAHNLLVTGARVCHFVSYDDRLPAGLDYFHVAVTPADVAIDEYTDDLHAFLADVDAEYESLLALRAA